MSFNDTSRLALQIKDILPHASYELIQRHITAAPTLDIDTVLASILDDERLHEDNEEQAATALRSSMSSPILQSVNFDSNPKSTDLKTSPSTTTPKKQPIRPKSYEERKFDLLNEARRRYLLKNPPPNQC